jgi:uncharacterized membrane protein
MGLLDSILQNTPGVKRLRPRLKIPFARAEIIGEIIAALIFVAGQTYLAFIWNQIPDRVPSHFGLAGQPDNYSGKETLLILSAVILILYVILSLLRRYPHIYNYPVAITDANAPKQYLYARTMICLLKAEVISLMSFIQWSTTQIALGNATDLNPDVMIGIVAVIVITTIIYFISAFRAK